MFSTKFLIYFFIVQCIIICCQFSPTKALIGPDVREAEPNEFPFVISIAGLHNVSRHQLRLLHQCTGSLVTRQDVVTADHCLSLRLSQGFRVLVGSSDLRHSTDYFPLFIWTYEHWARFIQRPSDGFPYHDIAFVKLTKNVPDNIPPVPYGNIENHLLYGLTVHTAGWGKLANGTKPRHLCTSDLQFISRIDCEVKLSMMRRQILTLDDIRVCTMREPHAVLSHGDSGGPLLYFGVLVGINHGVLPDLGDIIYPHQINNHISIRFYRDFFEQIRVRFHINFENTD